MTRWRPSTVHRTFSYLPIRASVYYQFTNRKTYSCAGVLIAGGAYVPLDPDYPCSQVNHIANDSGLKALLVNNEDVCAEYDNLFKCPVLNVLNTLDDALLPEPSGVDWHPPAPNTACYIIYTSGTTRRPKGCCLDHENVFHFIQYGTFTMYKGLGPGSRFLNSNPMVFDISCAIHFSTLSVGATLVLASKNALLDELELIINTTEVSCLACCPKSIEHMLLCV